MNNDLYEALINLGLPRLPKGYSYKFKIRDYDESIVNKWQDALYCSLRKHTFGIPHEIHRCVLGKGILVRWKVSGDMKESLEKGIVTEEELEQGKWLPAHLVHAGSYAFKKFEEAQAIKEAARLKKESERDITRQISQFLNKRLP